MDPNTIDEEALKQLLEVIGGKEEDFLELIEEFESTTPALMEDIRTAGGAQDWNALRISSHSLKSNARDFGALRLAALCEKLEHQCRSGSVEGPTAQIDQIGAELTAARKALADLKVGDA